MTSQLAGITRHVVKKEERERREGCRGEGVEGRGDGQLAGRAGKRSLAGVEFSSLCSSLVVCSDKRIAKKSLSEGIFLIH